jgi:hypothetical protein
VDIRNQARQLTEQTFGELAKARTHLDMASDGALDVQFQLGDLDGDVAKLTQLADRLTSKEKPGPSVADVKAGVEAVDDRLKEALDSVDTIRDHVQQAALTVAAGRVFATELEELYVDQEPTATEQNPPGRKVSSTAQLRKRLNTFDQAVKDATKQLDKATGLIGAAYTHLEPLRRVADLDDRSATATLIHDVVGRIGPDVAGASAGMEPTGLDRAGRSAYAAAKGADDLKRHVMAGLNPTDSADRRSQAAASGDDQRHRGDRSSQDRGLGR